MDIKEPWEPSFSMASPISAALCPEPAKLKAVLASSGSLTEQLPSSKSNFNETRKTKLPSRQQERDLPAFGGSGSCTSRPQGTSIPSAL